MGHEEVLQDATWEISGWNGKPDMLLNFRNNGFLSYEVFDVDEWPRDTELGQAICRRLAAAMNYCRGKTIRELEGKPEGSLDLLEALKGIVDLKVQVICESTAGKAALELALNNAHAAIAKAEGRS